MIYLPFNPEALRKLILTVLGTVLVIAGLATASFFLTGVIDTAEVARYRDNAVTKAKALVSSASSFMPKSAKRAPAAVDNRKKYINPYKSMPERFVRFGGLLIYRAEEGESVRSIARQAIEMTEYYRIGELADEIRSWNGIRGQSVANGMSVIIPGCLPARVDDWRNYRKPPLIEAKGLYLSGAAAGSAALIKHIPEYKRLGINTVVFDAKDITGIVNYRSGVPLAVKYDTHEHAPIANIRMLVRELNRNGIYSVARISVFQDHILHKEAPELAIRSRSGGKWAAGKNEKWLDPTNKVVQDYNIALALELIDIGVDEIQFDYIRFPTGGGQSDMMFRWDFGRTTREQCITAFLKRAHDKISAHNARLSIDIFGVVAWGKDVDIRATGQRIELLAQHCDALSPMLYPSHFNDNFDGYSKPGNNPYYFIYEGCRKVAAMAGRPIVVRPWLQAFRWRVSNYNEQYIVDQIKAARDAGAKGYLFWNASNDYATVLRALNGIHKRNLLARNEKNRKKEAAAD